MRRGWIVGPSYEINPFATDIAKSFLAAMMPPPDAEAGTRLVKTIGNLRAGEHLRALIERRDDPALTTTEEVTLTFLGARPAQRVLLVFSRIVLQHEERAAEPWLLIDITLY